VFPFKRYQIQPVWRADRPQKGRYREFFQCDVDVIGSDSLLNEVELIRIIDDVFDRLKVKVKINLNNRKILAGIAEYAGIPERISDITIALDKYEKVGWDKVKEEMTGKGIDADRINDFGNIVRVTGSDNTLKLNLLKSILADSAIGTQGIMELEKLMNIIRKSEINSEVIFDLTLARGLNYYTGAIIEVKSSDVSIGSICGGGRYDNLTGVFGMEGVSGVGISFGADRIYDVLNSLNLFDSTVSGSTRVMVGNFGEAETDYAFRIVNLLRSMGVNSELYPDQVKLRKQMSYADSKRIPFIILAGEDEIRNESVNIKNMSTGLQVTIPYNELRSYVMENILTLRVSG
jgi:histidyl-tRNA synthetase